MLNRSVFLSALVALAVLLPARVAHAHKTSVFAHAHGNQIHGQVLAEGGVPARGVKVTAYDPSGEILAETVADDKGEFSFTVTRRCDWKIVASGEGHQASCVVLVEELPADLSASPSAAPDHSHSSGDGHSHAGSAGSADEDEELHAQIVALRRDIVELKEKLRWQDIIGGIGYILGLMGIAFYFLGSRRGERFPSKSSD